MMSLFILLSVLAAMIFIEKKSHWVFWVISSISAGLALLTISPSIIVVPLVGLMLGVNYISQWKKQSQPGLWLGYFRWMLLFIGIICLVYVVLWPGMWVNPGKMLYEVFGNAISYAFQGSQLDVAKGLNPSRFSIDSSGIIPYFTSLFWRSTPITWLGVLFGCIGFLASIGKKANTIDSTFTPLIKRSIIYLGLIAAYFVLIFGIAKGRNSPHYILMSFVCLEMIAGIGLVYAIRWIGARIRPVRQGWIMIVLAISLLGVHIASGISQFPYYYTYLNPLMRLLVKGNPDAGYGEGLEKAGEYLSNKPNGSTLTAISLFGYGSFSYFFSGQFFHMPPTDIMEPSLLEDIRQSDYLVVYDIYQKRFYRPALLMDSLKGISPEKTIEINNLDYVSIYKVSDLPESLYKSLNQ
jgi:4-amino-4-deoxy-L-arabinose transferase-like glycosyltransferase